MRSYSLSTSSQLEGTTSEFPSLVLEAFKLISSFWTPQHSPKSHIISYLLGDEKQSNVSANIWNNATEHAEIPDCCQGKNKTMAALIEYHRCLCSAFAYVLFIHLYFLLCGSGKMKLK